MMLRLTNIVETALLPAARSSNGTPLYENRCPDCSAMRLSDKRKIGSPCAPCASKRRRTHGLCGTPLFKLLMNMRVRCEQPSASNYKYYGGAGIRVCDEWRNDPASFVAWATANGYRKGLEIDRKDGKGPYAPWNCQFIEHAHNSRKRSNQKCDEAKAAVVRSALASGATVKDSALLAEVPYMVAWHIKNSGTWQ